MSVPEKIEDPVEKKLNRYLEDYLEGNPAAKVIGQGLKVIGVGLSPVIDHFIFRTCDIDKWSQEFLAESYAYDEKLGLVESGFNRAKVFRKEGYPAILVEQPLLGEKGAQSNIPEWVQNFSEESLYGVVILVQDIEQAIFFLEKQGIAFTGKIYGKRDQKVRRTFSKHALKENKDYSVFGIVERHLGCQDF